MRQVILLDERVRNSAVDLARVSREMAELRERLSRIEGMMTAMVAAMRPVSPPVDRESLPKPPDKAG